jgi:hypothetical protein
MKKVEYNGKVYDARHGGPFDRGAADSYYGRAPRPHYFVGDTYSSDEVTRDQMTREEREAYHAGYDYNEEMGDKKDW